MNARALPGMARVASTRLAVGLVATALLVGCGSLTFPDGNPAIQGDIVGVGPGIPFGAENRIWVKETPEAPCGIVFAVTGGTEIGEAQPDGSIAERSFADLTEGRTVRVWAGPIAESCPGQGRADAIELIPRLEE